MPESLQPTSIRLPLDLKDKLQKLATIRRQPLSLMIIYALEEFWRQSRTFMERRTPLSRKKRKKPDAKAPQSQPEGRTGDHHDPSAEGT